MGNPAASAPRGSGKKTHTQSQDDTRRSARCLYEEAFHALPVPDRHGTAAAIYLFLYLFIFSPANEIPSLSSPTSHHGSWLSDDLYCRKALEIFLLSKIVNILGGRIVVEHHKMAAKDYFLM